MSMHTEISEGVKISVVPRYFEGYSNITDSLYFFKYTITIENLKNSKIQLLHRHWHIFDTLDQSRIIEGDGVVGDNPSLFPGESYSYTSGCDLSSEIGFMEGFYQFKNLVSGEVFNVKIPRFEMYFPGKLN